MGRSRFLGTGVQRSFLEAHHIELVGVNGTARAGPYHVFPFQRRQDGPGTGFYDSGHVFSPSNIRLSRLHCVGAILPV